MSLFRIVLLSLIIWMNRTLIPPPSLFFLGLSRSVQWWSPWRWQRQWSDLRSSTEMPLGFAECAATRQPAFTSTQWHARAAKGFSGRSYLIGSFLLYPEMVRRNLSCHLFKVTTLSLYLQVILLETSVVVVWSIKLVLSTPARKFVSN